MHQICFTASLAVFRIHFDFLFAVVVVVLGCWQRVYAVYLLWGLTATATQHQQLELHFGGLYYAYI